MNEDQLLWQINISTSEGSQLVCFGDDKLRDEILAEVQSPAGGEFVAFKAICNHPDRASQYVCVRRDAINLVSCVRS